MLQKLISGDALRKSRLHDEKGNFVGLSRLISHGPKAVATGLMRLSFDYRPSQPWISYSVIQILEKHLTRSSRVLEFGSGMSTVWYARHAGEVCSVEDYKPWYEKVKKILINEKLQNVNYQFKDHVDSYSQCFTDDSRGFDLIMVDGSHRSACIAHAVKLLRPGGILYLDNTDKDSTPRGGDMRLAENNAPQFAKGKNAEIFYFTDFAPTQLFVQQGLMVKLPNHLARPK